MDILRRNLIRLSAIAAAALAVGGCGYAPAEWETQTQAEPFTVSTDATVSHDARSITLTFNRPVDFRTVTQENIALSDKTGSLVQMHSVALDFEDVSQRSILITLGEEYSLRESWKYTVVVTEAVRSTEGESLPGPVSLELYTTSRSPFEAAEAARSKIMVISDLHLNQQRGYDEGYSLFTENGATLAAFLEAVRQSGQIKELVILGDLMDMWVIPMSYETFDAATADTEAYFSSVADAVVNKEIIDKLNQIADEGLIRFSYVPGNHDMLLTESVFRVLFPNGYWQGAETGTGAYFPEAGIALEHGHNYDLFNAPDPLTTEGSLLPPGYFITRIFATHNLLAVAGASLAPEAQAPEGILQELEYMLGWDLAVTSFDLPDFNPDEPSIVTGVDGYDERYSSNGARDIYTETIGPNWVQRQTANGVWQPDPLFIGEMNASGKFWWFGTLEASAIQQYFIPERAKIAVFGHTHQAMIRKNLLTLYKIYANSGTWVDSKYLNDGALNRTCVVLNSSASSGSDLDNVTVYRCLDDLTLQKVGEENLDTTLPPA